jgi:hypothetical protein
MHKAVGNPTEPAALTVLVEMLVGGTSPMVLAEFLALAATPEGVTSLMAREAPSEQAVTPAEASNPMALAVCLVPVTMQEAVGSPTVLVVLLAQAQMLAVRANQMVQVVFSATEIVDGVTGPGNPRKIPSSISGST